MSNVQSAYFTNIVCKKSLRAYHKIADLYVKSGKNIGIRSTEGDGWKTEWTLCLGCPVTIGQVREKGGLKRAFCDWIRIC